MRTNAQLKQEAKDVLAGRWKEAVLMNLIPAAIQILAVLVIAALFAIPAFFLWNTNTVQEVIHNGEFANNIDLNLGSQSGSGLFGGIIGTFFTVGISWTFLDLLRGSKTSIVPLKDALRGFQAPYGIGILVIYLLSSIFTFFWTLLFIIPGIIKSYAYSQAYFIYYDEYRQTGVPPQYLDSITKSRRLMNGHKGRLFLLDLSFIGWHFIAALTLGIGYLWLMPYISATKAAFYADLAQNN